MALVHRLVDGSMRVGMGGGISLRDRLDQSMLCVDMGSRRELLMKDGEAEHESGVPFTGAVSTWPGVSHGSLRIWSIERSMVRCWEHVKRTLSMHNPVMSGGTRSQEIYTWFGRH